MRNLFEEGEAVLTVLTAEMMGVAEVTGVTEGPFPVTRTPFFPMLDKGSSFLDLIFVYMSLLNLVVISARMGAQESKTNTDDLTPNEVNTYSFFLQY